jgi:hypothetical protein
MALVTPSAARQFAVGSVREMSRRGDEEIVIHQDKRYINADALSIDGKWYRVDTSPMNMGISVSCERAGLDMRVIDECGMVGTWIDELGGKI